jgi:hypothetical protein
MRKHVTFASRHIKYKWAVATINTLYNVALKFVCHVNWGGFRGMMLAYQTLMAIKTNVD